MDRVINLDNAAATPLHPDVKKRMIDYLETTYANPSSQHSLGDLAAEALDIAREQVAALVGAEPREIVFGSGGTESINHAIKGVAFAKRDKGKHIITSNIEHNAVLRTLRALRLMDWRVTSLDVDEYGLVDPQAVAEAITDETVLITVMHANNEIGTVEPIAEIGAVARERKIVFHTDAVASAGLVPLDVKAMNVDLLSLAANQFYGPSGAGALYVKRGTALWPLLDGGVQEQNKRAGTQNMLGIVGLGVAAEIARAEMDKRAEHTRGLKGRMAAGLKKGIEHLIFNGHPEKCLPHLLSVSVGFIEGESMMIMLDEDGVAVTTRSACAAGALQASHVLLGIGLDFADAQGTLVFTFSPENTEADVDYVVEKLPPIVERLREMSPLYKK
ncbi:MAG: cysteine desulfurase [Proteobacteria bacterium]|nr:cysteine desulfurase [Pseudomonadota bacterium]